jgi:hypothetical protein
MLNRYTRLPIIVRDTDEVMWLATLIDEHVGRFGRAFSFCFSPRRFPD